ncbi:MAG: hydroxysqualene dehydroxylase HpnE [Calditrichia bacterium]
MIIIGGGLAGLSAAIQAIEEGFRPIILERNRYLGGRVRSFYAEDFKQHMDNGQHILSAAYEETIWFLNKIGALQKVHFQEQFTVNFVKSTRQRFLFKPYPLPAPLHFFVPLLFKSQYLKTGIGEYGNFIRQNLFFSETKLREMTVQEWLKNSRFNEHLIEFLFEPMTLAILNTPIEQASAFLLQKAISKSFFYSRKNARLGIPGDWLSEIFVIPAQDIIARHGGSIYHLSPVEKLIIAENRVDAVVTRDGMLDAPYLICAVPPYALVKLLETSNIAELNNLSRCAEQFNYHPIVTINIILRKPLSGPFPIALVASPIHWIFPHPQPAETTGEFGYALVISAADRWREVPPEEMMSMVRRELLRALQVDIQGSHRLLRYKIIKEKRATISQTPRANANRPATTTALENLFLAGDWIDTGLPATIESAIFSGRLAARSLESAFRSDSGSR